MLPTPLYLLLLILPLIQATTVPEDIEKGNGHYGCPECVRGKPSCSSSSSCSSSFDNPNVFFQQCCKSDNVVEDIVWLQPDVGFYAFGFQSGNTGGQSCQTFYLNAPTCTLLWVTDCYCPGDQFRVIIDGEDPTIKSVYEIRSMFTLDTNCPNWTNHPYNCFNNPMLFARNNVPIIIPAGFHTITIDIMVSLYREGTGYALLQTADPTYNYPACEDPTSALYPCVYSIYYPYDPFNI